MPETEHTSTRNWTPGQAGSQQIQTQPRFQEKVWGWVALTATPGTFQATFDGNTGPDYGPVDLPCVVAIELPVTVTIARITVDATAQSVAASWGVGCPPFRDRGRVLSLGAAVVAPLAPWEYEADVPNPAVTADWLDAAGVVVSSFAIHGFRPIGAVAIRLNLADDVRLRG